MMPDLLTSWCLATLAYGTVVCNVGSRQDQAPEHRPVPGYRRYG